MHKIPREKQTYGEWNTRRPPKSILIQYSLVPALLTSEIGSSFWPRGGKLVAYPPSAKVGKLQIPSLIDKAGRTPEMGIGVSWPGEGTLAAPEILVPVGKDL